MTVRSHLFPFRTQKLSSLVPKIVGWTRPVKIGRCRLLSPIRLLKPQSDGHAPLAQLVEQLTLNQWAQGSSPWRCTRKMTQDRKILRHFFVKKGLHIFCTSFAHHPKLGASRASSAQPAFPCTKRKFLGEQQPDKRVTPKFCVKSNECRNRANLYVGGSGLTVCRLCLQHNAGGE